MKPQIVIAMIPVIVGWGLLWPAAPAHSQWAPWCIQYLDRSGVRECGFHSYQQCMETASGGVGNCFQNPDYRPISRDRQLRRY